MKVPLPGGPSGGGEIRRGRSDDRERRGVAREEHGERAARPVDVYGEVVPRAGCEGGREEGGERVVEDFERVCVRGGEWAGWVCEGRACRRDATRGGLDYAGRRRPRREREREQNTRRRTELDAEHVRPVPRLNKHDLVLVRHVQRPSRVLFDRELEHGRPRVEHGVEVVVVAVDGGDEFGAAEAELGAAAAGDEDGGVVDRDGDGLFAGEDEGGVPEGGGWLGVAEEVRVLCVRGRGGCE